QGMDSSPPTTANTEDACLPRYPMSARQPVFRSFLQGRLCTLRTVRLPKGVRFCPCTKILFCTDRCLRRHFSALLAKHQVCRYLQPIPPDARLPYQFFRSQVSPTPSLAPRKRLASVCIPQSIHHPGSHVLLRR